MSGKLSDKEMAVALAGAIAVAAVNGAIFDDDDIAWSQEQLRGVKEPPIVAIKAAIAALSRGADHE